MFALSVVQMVQLKGLKRQALPVHSIAINENILIGGTMDGPFAVSMDSFDEPVWSSSFGYQGVACSSISVTGVFVLASFRSLPPNSDQPSRHIIFRINRIEEANNVVDKENNPNEAIQIDLTGENETVQLECSNANKPEDETTPICSDNFWEFKSQAGHRMPFKSALLLSQDHFQVFLSDEQSSSGQCYLINAGGDGQMAGCPQLMPVEVYPTNAGIPIVDCCVGQIASATTNACSGSENREEQREVLALLTEKHLYLYSN